MDCTKTVSHLRVIFNQSRKTKRKGEDGRTYSRMGLKSIESSTRYEVLPDGKKRGSVLRIDLTSFFLLSETTNLLSKSSVREI